MHLFRRTGALAPAFVALVALGISCTDAASPSKPVVAADTANAFKWPWQTRTVSVTVSIDSTSISATHVAHATAVAKDLFRSPIADKTATWSSTDNSVATVSATGDITGIKAGSVTIQGTIDGISAGASLVVTAAPVKTAVPAALGVQTQPGGAVTGAKFVTQPAVRILDNAGAVVANSALPVTAAITSGSGTLAGTKTVNATNGVATFTDLQVNGTGNTVVTFSTVAPVMKVASVEFMVSAMPATQIAIATQPAGAVSGARLTTQPLVQIRDASNAVATNSTAAVTASIASGTGKLSGTMTATAVNGVATFSDLTITGAGTSTIVFASSGLTSATSATVNVAAAAAAKASQLTITTQPSTAASSGAALAQQPVVQLRDASGAAVSQAGVSVTATIATGGGTLGGTSSATTNGSGTATFSNLSITGVDGSRTLSFASSGLTSATSGSITLTTAPVVPPPSGSGTPLVLEDFSTYSSTANLLSNPRGVWNTGNALNTSQVVLDATVGYGSSTKSMRYDFPNKGAVCADYGIHPGMVKIPGNQTHVWIEFVVRFATNFTVSAGATGCAQEFKLGAMGDANNGHGRWNIAEMQAGEFVVGYPDADLIIDGASPAPASLWDGQPHVFRAEAALSQNGTGILRWWVDGKLRVNKTGFNTDPSHAVIDYFTPGLNINQGPGANMSMWWQKIAVYNTNPGW